MLGEQENRVMRKTDKWKGKTPFTKQSAVGNVKIKLALRNEESHPKLLFWGRGLSWLWFPTAFKHTGNLIKRCYFPNCWGFSQRLPRLSRLAVLVWSRDCSISSKIWQAVRSGTQCPGQIEILSVYARQGIYFACCVPNSPGFFQRTGTQSLLALYHKPSCSAALCSALQGPHFTGYGKLHFSLEVGGYTQPAHRLTTFSSSDGRNPCANN